MNGIFLECSDHAVCLSPLSFQTINEGLITPVIRRKQFNQPSTLTFNGNPLSSIPLSKRATHSPNVNSPCTLISRGREALEALFAQQRNTSPPAVAAAGGLERRLVQRLSSILLPSQRLIVLSEPVSFFSLSNSTFYALNFAFRLAS